MSGMFRKHYSYGETIPTLDTHVGMSVDIFEETNRQSPHGPYLKAVLTATAGPLKSPPLIVEPLQENISKILHLSNIPVPIPQVRTVDLSLICDIVNYRWTPAQDGQRHSGVVTFDLRLRAAFSLMGRSFTLQLDQRPCTITLTKQLVPTQMQVVGAGTGFEGTLPQGTQSYGQAGVEQMQETQSYGRGTQERVPSGVTNGGNIAPDSLNAFTNQLDIEERLRELGQRLLSRT